MRLLSVFLLPTLAFAADVPNYVHDVQPILTAHCAGCHNADEAYSGFRVDAFEHVVTPITSEDALQQGPSLTPGTAETSRIYRLMAGLDEPRMPPVDDADPVPSEQLAVIKKWIDAGAMGPEGGSVVPALVVPAVPAAESPSPVTSVLSAGSRLIAGSYGAVRAIDGDKTLWTDDSLPGKVTDLVLSPDGNTIYAATGTTGLVGQVIGFDVTTGRRTVELTGHRDTIYTAAISPDGNVLATGSYDRDVILWDLTSGEALQTLAGHNGAVFDVAFDPRGELVASASGDETVKVWSVATGERLDTMPQPEGEVYSVTFTPDARFVLAGSADNRVRKWRIKSRGRKVINPLMIARFAHEAGVTNVELTPDGKRVISAAADRVIRVWTAGNLTQLATLGPLDDVVATLDASSSPGKVTAWLMNGTSRTFALPKSSKPATVIADAVPPVFVDLSDKMTETVNEAEPNNALDKVASLTLPARVNGVISEPGDVDFYSFEAKRGEQWVVEVEASRKQAKPAGSKLDSVVEVLDADGNRIERVLLQAVRDSYFTFRGKNSSQVNDYRVFNWQEMELGDLFYANGEVSEFFMYPAGPDSGFTVFPGKGTRHLRFDTTGVAHALGDPAYVVKPYPPGSQIAPNGLPIFPIYFANDDDASRRHGKDSVVSFTAPEDGRFVVRVSDARFDGSEKHTYTLHVRPRKPDFAISVARKADKVQAGSATMLTARVTRLDGFEGPVSIQIEGLPEGFVAPDDLTVEARQQETHFPLLIAEGISTPTAEQLKAIRVVASAETEDGRDVRHEAVGIGKLEVAEKPAPFSLEVFAPMVDGLPTIELRPGETTTLTVKADRRDFKGRIQFGKQDAGRNLPFGVFVDNIGLNGLMIPEGKSEQEFFVTASPVAQPQERLWFLFAGEGGGVASNLVRVRVLPEAEKVASN